MRGNATRMLGALAASALLLTACGGGGGGDTDPAAAGFDRAAVFRYAIPANPSSFDPRRSNPLDPIFLNVVYESLIERSPAGEIQPGLATEWRFNADNTVLDLTLRDGVTFHNGEKLDAAAAVASIEALRTTGTQASALAPVSAVEATGPNTMRITFSTPAGYMLNVLAGEAGIIVAPSGLTGPDLGTKPIGTGAFELTSLERGHITFARFDDYWNAAETSIAGIDMRVFSDEPTRLRAVISGEIDGAPISPGQVREAKASGLSVVEGPNSTVMAILLNTSKGEFGNPLVRKALMYGIDRTAITDSLLDGGCTPTVQPFVDSFWPSVPALQDAQRYHDVAKAKSLLAEAGFPNGLSFELVSGSNTSYQNLAQAVQAQLAEIGVTVAAQAMENSQLVERRRDGNFAASVALLQVGRPDPSQFIADFYVPGGAFNPGGFTVAGLADHLAQSRASSDEAERQKITQSIFSDAFDAGPPVIPVCGAHYVGAFRDGVSGMEVPKFSDYDFTTIKISG